MIKKWVLIRAATDEETNFIKESGIESSLSSVPIMYNRGWRDSRWCGQHYANGVTAVGVNNRIVFRPTPKQETLLILKFGNSIAEISDELVSALNFVTEILDN
jgi:hypothetical protein